MHFTSETSSDGVIERSFRLGDIPGVLWTPAGADATRPVILLGHGGGQHKTAPGIVARARRFVTEGGFAAVAVDAPGHGDRPRSPEFDRILGDIRAQVAAGAEPAPLFAEFHTYLARLAVPEWSAVLDAVQPVAGTGPAGYWGLSLGCGLGVPFVAAEPRVRAAVLGLFASPNLAGAAARITVPVEFLVQWDDERVPRADSLALYDALGSPEKSLHAHPGRHADLPRFEIDSTLRFFARHLG